MNVLWFSHRKKLEILYQKWLADNPTVKDCPFNVISFLEGKGLLKYGRAMRAIKNTVIPTRNDEAKGE